MIALPDCLGPKVLNGRAITIGNSKEVKMSRLLGQHQFLKQSMAIDLLLDGTVNWNSLCRSIHLTGRRVNNSRHTMFLPMIVRSRCQLRWFQNKMRALCKSKEL